jgi:hypothetical protein
MGTGIMKKWNAFWMGLALCLGLTAPLWAQVPGAPPAAAPAAAPTKNIFTMLLPSAEQCEKLKICFCNSAIGKIINGMFKPAVAFSGGLIQDRCAALAIAQDLAKPADSAEGAAARIKDDEAKAKARREAARYLGTVDCRYWPEAEEGLITALRADRNECVRLEAAIALGRGCCCTVKTVEALALTVSGSDKDKNPPERSERVKAAALMALDNCLANHQPLEGAAPVEEIKKPKDEKDEKDRKEEKDKQGNAVQNLKTPAEYYKHIATLPRHVVFENARRILVEATATPQSVVGGRTGGSVVQIISRAFATTNPATGAPPMSEVVPAVRATPPPPMPSGMQPIVHSQPAPAVPASQVRTTPYQPVVPVRSPQAVPQTAKPQIAMHAQLSAEAQERMQQLRFGRTPSDRQSAAEWLTVSPWATHPEVMHSLTLAGREDASPAVRTTCLRCLATINFHRLP